MAIAILVFGVIFGLGIVVTSFLQPKAGLRRLAAVGAIIIMVGALLLSSFRNINADEVGVVVKNLGTKSLSEGAYIAINGEQGIQADVLAPGWHFGYWPFVYDVREVPLTVVKSGEVGILETTDGLPMEPGQIFGPEFKPAEFQQMLDARYFLTTGKGRKGAQSSVLTAGKYRLNTELFKVKMVPVTEVVPGEVAVLKSNFGSPPSLMVEGVAGVLHADAENAPPSHDSRLYLAKAGEMGILADVLTPGKYPLNTDAFSVTEIWTTQMIAHYSADLAGNPAYDAKNDRTTMAQTEEREITVRTSDGFTFPVDVRIEYSIEPRNAPIVVAKLGDDAGDRFKNAINSAVRAIFRNGAEAVKALDYVQQRSHQEEQSLKTLKEQMARFGVTITAVRIGAVGDEQSLGALLKTQTDRELAKQELLTFQEQQKTAEKQKELNKVKQESEEERKLATAAYAVKIASETAKQRITEAEAEAQAIQIRAQAQADAYALIARQIGPANAAMIELLKIIGERNINIAPRVLVTGGGTGSNGAADGTTAALIGTMLDSMVDRSDLPAPTSSPSTAAPRTAGTKPQ